MPRITEEKKEETRRAILSVSKKLFMNDGYYNTSTNQIARDVGIAEGTIFNYFETKADIFLLSVAGDYFNFAEPEDDSGIISADAVESILNYIHKRLDRILTLPKKVLIELATVLLGKVTSKKDIVDELVLVDQNIIEKLTAFIETLQKANLVKETSSKTIGECIFGIVSMELFIYLNIQTYSKDDAVSGIKEKVTVLMTGHLTGE